MFVLVAMFVVGLTVGLLVGWRLLQGWRRRTVEREFGDWRVVEEEHIAAEAQHRSEAVLTGKIAEQFAPLWLDFPFHPRDVRFLGSPIDFVVFDGATEARQGRGAALRRIVFVDIKTGNARLTPVQRRIKQCVESGRVHYEDITIESAAPGA